MTGSVGRFSDRAEVYASARPTYPEAAVDAILADLPANIVVADIGAGTGISSRIFADRGLRVIAVEPDAAMRAEGERGGSGLIEWHDGWGERTGLADGCVNLVVCAQAFHWMDADAAAGEFVRICRPGGRVALMWNVHDESDPLMCRYRGIMLEHATDPPRSPWSRGFNDVLAGAQEVLDFRVERFRHMQVVSREGLLGRALSSSYAPLAGVAGHDGLVGALERLFEEGAVDGRMALRYETSVYLAERP